jgi:hypothetical protein
MTTGKPYFIEENGNGKFAVRAKGSQRASGLRDTQKQAETLVKKLNPNDKPNVERVRNTKPVDGISGEQSENLQPCLVVKLLSFL